MSGHKFQAGKPILIVQPPASQYARPVKDGGPAANVLETCSQSASTQRWVSKLFASASLAYPYSLQIIFLWPPVLAWWRDATAGGVLAMLESVPFRQSWPGGRPGAEGDVDHSA